MNRALLPMATERLSAEPDYADENISVRLRGSCDLGTSASVAEFLSALHAEALNARVPAVVVHMEEVSFMNSASIKAFVDWVSHVRALDPPQRYRVVFRTNRQFAWQRRSLEAIRRFAPELVRLEVSL